MYRVVHLGPSESKGGMATVIQNLHHNPPAGWSSSVINTHHESAIKMISKWFNSRRELKRILSLGEVDIAHIHVTHNLSWVRKRSMMRVCQKMGVPMVIHIHSGKFDIFCRGKFENSVKLELTKKERKVLVLEERWRNILSPLIGSDNLTVVPNPSHPNISRKGHKLEGTLKILVLSRGAKCKGNEFAIRIADRIHRMGNNVSISLTGISRHKENISSNLEVNCLGWVSNEEKNRLLQISDILLSPSDYEGSSMSVIESVVCGLPCIVSQASNETVGIEELVVKGQDPDKWATAIIDLAYGGRYEEISESLLDIGKKYRIEKTNERLCQVYADLVSK